MLPETKQEEKSIMHSAASSRFENRFKTTAVLEIAMTEEACYVQSLRLGTATPTTTDPSMKYHDKMIMDTDMSDWSQPER